VNTPPAPPSNPYAPPRGDDIHQLEEIALGTLSFGRTLGLALASLLENGRIVFGLALLAIPIAAVDAFALTDKTWISNIFNMFAYPVLQIPLTLAVSDWLQRKAPGDVVSRSGARYFPVVGAAFLQGLAILIGLIFLVIPGIYFAILFGLAAPAAVLANCGPSSALDYSKRLVKGRWFFTFAVLGFAVLPLISYWVGLGMLMAATPQLTIWLDPVFMSLLGALGTALNLFTTAVGTITFRNLEAQRQLGI
jgi:hypothetical protein